MFIQPQILYYFYKLVHRKISYLFYNVQGRRRQDGADNIGAA